MENDIVISGISGRFPESANIAEFSENLFNKVVLTTEIRRWNPDLYTLPRKMGQLKDLTKFDSNFFGVNPKQADILDPQLRILLELTYESIVDAGYDKEELFGRNIGVFIGNTIAESDEFFCYDVKKISGYELSACWRNMFANRISYAFDFKGPSLLLDSACSSGAVALCEAMQAIQNNKCEAAIVGACNICLKPASSYELYKANTLSDDGVCKTFDADANGYCRSEGIVAIFLQKFPAARRNYASIVHIKTNTDGYKDEGVLYPSATMQKRLLKEVYNECNLDPLEISYLEAHGTGTPVGDYVEMSAISEIFCPGRKEPFLVGSVKSNMGHSEPTSDLCSVAKLIISMEKNLIPPNLHFNKPNPKIKSLVDNKVKIVTDSTPLEGNYTAMNSFGIGGVNVHAVFKSNTNERKLNKIEEMPIPQLALYGGRTDEGIQHLFDSIENQMPPREFFALLHKSANSSAVGKPYRGYKILLKDQDASEIKKLKAEKNPVWYVFPGMGTQWPCMAKDLMNLEVFSRSIKDSAEVLKPHGVDLIDLLTNEGQLDSNSRGVIQAFVCIAAMQVALVDVLKEIGITPDGIVGHSVGELGCAYADECFTAKQTVLSAYWRGKALHDSNLDIGAMAAVGLTWSQAHKSCPKDIYPSCHNAEDSVTISGPESSVKHFVDALKAENVFAKEVDSCGYAFHSPYVFPAAEKLQTSLEKVIPNPTSRWISSSFPKHEWHDESAKLAGASYFVHNLVSPVLFCESLQHVPENAIVIEIAPHHLLQAILKRAIGPEAVYIGLMKKNTNNVIQLLTSIGRLYTAGLNLDIETLYPKVEFPVPKGTPMISPLIKWDHSDSWCVAKFDQNTNMSQMIVEVNISAEDTTDKYILDHCLDGRCLYPATGYLVLIWKAFAEIKGKDFSTFPVILEDVRIHVATVLSDKAIKYIIDITKAGGEFEISENGMVICTGRIYSEEGGKTEASEVLKSIDVEDLSLNQSDIYKELKIRGYDYGPTFKGLAKADIHGNKGLLKWTGKWVVFLDTMLQFSQLSYQKRHLHLPTSLESIKINPLLHKSVLNSTLKEYKGVPIFYDKKGDQMISGGVEINHLKGNLAPKNIDKKIPLLEEYRFIPYTDTNTLSKCNGKTLGNYIHACSLVAKKIFELSFKSKGEILDVIKEFSETDNALIVNHSKSGNENHVLLKTLYGLMNEVNSNGFMKHVENYVNSYLSERQNDMLYQTLLQENPLRTLIDIVLENGSSENLKIVEIADSNSPLVIKINEFFQTYGVVNINYLIAHNKPELFDKSKLTSDNCEVSSWDRKSALSFKDVDLCVMKFLNHSNEENRQVIENALKTLKDNGFILLLQRTHLVPAEIILSDLSKIVLPIQTEYDLEQTFNDLNVKVICKKSDSLTSTMYLLRKSTNISYTDVVIPVIEDKYEKWVNELREQITIASESSDPMRIWLLNEASNTGIIGLVNCLRQEPGGSSIRCVFTSKDYSKLPQFGLKSQFYQEVVQKNLTMNVYKNDTWGCFRHITMSEEPLKVKTEHAYLNVLTRGDLSSFAWVDSYLKYFKESSDNCICQVYYAPLNFRDIMLASGKLAADAIPGDLAYEDCILGLEFSGRLQNGRRVMGTTKSKGLATTVSTNPNFVWEVPDDWSLAEACTVPVAYSTAYYALIMRGNLKKGERVLIHSGSGGVGQAAIAVALSLECEVFTTVGSKEKREFLKKRFSQLQDRNICNSRDTSFKKHILTETYGEGVEVILNSLADEKLKATLHCLARNGRFLEIGKADMANNTALGMAMFLKNVSFIGVLLEAAFEDNVRSSHTKKELFQLVKDGIENGVVKPLNYTLFERDQAEQAFRFMATGKHIGKIVLKIKDEEPIKKTVPSPVEITALARTTCDSEKTYIIIGGLGGFGLELCQWLVDRGAQHIILTSRSGIKTGYQKFCMNRWKQDNINVIVSKLNATKLDEAIALLKMAAEVKPVAAIFNLALVLKDAFMINQTVEMFKEVCESKVASTVNLDAISRKLCPTLKWFVCFSSVSCGRGNAGQSNYGYANSVMERICEERSKDGLPGLAIQWGAIADVGVIHDATWADVIINGTVPQRINSCLKVLDKFLQQNQPVVSSFVPYELYKTTTVKKSKQTAMSTVCNILGIKDLSIINPEASLGELGMDSLMGVEMKQFLDRDFNLGFTISELRLLKVNDLKNLGSSGETAKTTPTPESTIKSSSNSVSETDTEVAEGYLGHFASLTGNEIVPTETITQMNSVTNGTPLFIVHPIEGTVAILSPLAQKVNFPVYGIQYTSEAPSESIEQLASWYWEKIKSLGVNDTICLSGYSYGSSIAFEMCLQAERDLQQHPKVRKLILLDGSPSLMADMCRVRNSHFPSDATTEDEIQALCAFVSQFVDINMMEFQKELMKLPLFADRINKSVEKIIATHKNLQAKNLSSAFNLYHKKILMSRMYKPKYKLEKEIILIKSSDSFYATKNFSESYDLEKVCNKEIVVRTVTGTHKTFVAAEEISNILNDVLA